MGNKQETILRFHNVPLRNASHGKINSWVAIPRQAYRAKMRPIEFDERAKPPINLKGTGTENLGLVGLVGLEGLKGSVKPELEEEDIGGGLNNAG